jgi:predicted P-loop ATPase
MSDRPMDYDPMVYDTLRELATQLGGAYVARSDACDSPAERDRWMEMTVALGVEVREVDVHDEAAVRAKTDEISQRLDALRLAS